MHNVPGYTSTPVFIKCAFNDRGVAGNQTHRESSRHTGWTECCSLGVRCSLLRFHAPPCRCLPPTAARLELSIESAGSRGRAVLSPAEDRLQMASSRAMAAGNMLRHPMCVLIPGFSGQYHDEINCRAQHNTAAALVLPGQYHFRICCSLSVALVVPCTGLIPVVKLHGEFMGFPEPTHQSTCQLRSTPTGSKQLRTDTFHANLYAPPAQQYLHMPESAWSGARHTNIINRQHSWHEIPLLLLLESVLCAWNQRLYTPRCVGAAVGYVPAPSRTTLIPTGAP